VPPWLGGAEPISLSESSLGWSAYRAGLLVPSRSGMALFSRRSELPLGPSGRPWVERCFFGSLLRPFMVLTVSMRLEIVERPASDQTSEA
jgi:hypothetical protein